MLSRSSNVAIRAAARQYSRSIVVQQESSAAPKMHNATGNWASLKSKRPVDADDLHRVFHPPYDRVTVVLLIGGIVGFGWGSMWYGVVHQQYKQGFWK